MNGTKLLSLYSRNSLIACRTDSVARELPPPLLGTDLTARPSRPPAHYVWSLQTSLRCSREVRPFDRSRPLALGSVLARTELEKFLEEKLDRDTDSIVACCRTGTARK
ncbi:uncharacterized protein LOC143143974 [Ptiloglossa arizonensis]|uniref:uncharacterized protein LOC143143974 n=1 Tax=Ptiloglossa arizonensis TaxID=3350558 RepID=UPI003FA054F7